MNFPNLTWRQIWTTALIAIVASFAMWKGGIVTGFWTTIGIFGFAVLLSLVSLLGNPARLVATVALLVWALLTVVYPAVGNLFRAEWPLLSFALQQRKDVQDMELHDLLNPSAARVRVGYAQYCKNVEQLQSAYVETVLYAEYQRIAGLAGMSADPNRLAVLPPTRWERLKSMFGYQRPASLFPTPRRFADMKFHTANGEERSVADVISIIEEERTECRTFYARSAPPELPPRPGDKDATSAVKNFLGDGDRLSAARGFFSTKSGFWAIGFALIALLIISAIFGRTKVSSAVIGIVVILIILVLFVENYESTKQELFGAAAAGSLYKDPDRPMDYGRKDEVPGQAAPRPTAATLVEKRTDGYYVSIDGADRHGHVALMLAPGDVAEIEYLGGTIALNTHGDRYRPCGTHRVPQVSEEFPFYPDIKPYAVGFYLRPPGRSAGVTPLPCNEGGVVKVQNRGDRIAELVFVYNQAWKYRDQMTGKQRDDGYLYVGWDAGTDPHNHRARFKVAVRKG